jgi:hypothetical protein
MKESTAPSMFVYFASRGMQVVRESGVWYVLLKGNMEASFALPYLMKKN